MPLAEDKLNLNVLLTEYPNTAALRAGEIGSDLIELDFAPKGVLFENFRPMIREQKFDVCEMPIVTALQALQYGKDLVLLPFIMNGRFQHDCLVHNRERPLAGAEALKGKRLGVRSYAQTTVAWLAGILERDYGVAASDIEWVAINNSHVDDYTDPEFCSRAAPGSKLPAMLVEGEIDAAVLASFLYDDERIEPMIPDANAAALDWYRRTGNRPMNHMVMVTGALMRERPDAVAELYRMLVASKRRAALPGHGIDLTASGIEGHRHSLQAIIDYCHGARLIDRPMTVDEIYAGLPGDRALWAEAVDLTA